MNKYFITVPAIGNSISKQDRTIEKQDNVSLVQDIKVKSQKWMSGEDVCCLLMISKRTLQSYRDRGILPFAQIGRKIYYKASDIDEYLDQHYIKSNYQKKFAS
jgi:excisionase family DNA binding protein